MTYTRRPEICINELYLTLFHILIVHKNDFKFGIKTVHVWRPRAKKTNLEADTFRIKHVCSVQCGNRIRTHLFLINRWQMYSHYDSLVVVILKHKNFKYVQKTVGSINLQSNRNCNTCDWYNRTPDPLNWNSFGIDIIWRLKIQKYETFSKNIHVIVVYTLYLPKQKYSTRRRSWEIQTQAKTIRSLFASCLSIRPHYQYVWSSFYYL